MSIDFSTEQTMARDSISRITGDICSREYLARMDKEGRYPQEAYDAWIEAGAFAMPFPELYGGLGGNVVAV